VAFGLFTDLDGTIVFSRRWLNGIDSARTVPVEWNHADVHRAWMTAPAWDGLLQLRSIGAELIPTTTRTGRQFAPLHLPGGPTRAAIAANGMRVVWDGEVDREWSDRMADPSWGCTPIHAINDVLQQVVDGAGWARRAYVDDGIGVAVAEHGHVIPEHVVRELQQLAHDTGYTLWRQRRKTYLIPSHATKEAAAEEVTRRLGRPVTAAAGDTVLDHGLLAWADLALQPAHADPGSATPTTNRTGMHASTDIAVWALQHARAVLGIEGTPETRPQGWSA
jgi:hypothetical protein